MVSSVHSRLECPSDVGRRGGLKKAWIGVLWPGGGVELAWVAQCGAQLGLGSACLDGAWLVCCVRVWNVKGQRCGPPTDTVVVNVRGMPVASYGMYP